MIGRGRAAACALAVAALALSSCSHAGRQDGRTLGAHVTVEHGELIGIGDRGVLRYQGIPYAAPPVGDLRWAPPQPPAAWTTARPAVLPGARCPQEAAAPGTPHATAASESEDCLTLNVTVPAGTPASSRLPVLVWFHGGGFSAGAGSDLDPRRLAQAGPMVVVTLNYRLGMLGFLGLPGLPGSGSFGLLDQQAALRWVRRNIALFGGDPGQITLGGESAGADSVCTQIASPMAIGLFVRAILQSGGCGAANLVDVIRPGTGSGGDTWKPLPLVHSASAGTAVALGCPDPASMVGCLRGLPVARLVGPQPGAPAVYWSPATATSTLPRRPSDLITSRDLRPMPVLAGTTRDEGTLFTAAFFDRAGAPLTATGVQAMLASAAGSRTAEAEAAYRPSRRSPGRAWSDVVTDRAFACTALATYRGLGPRAPLFAYEFADASAPATFAALPPELADGVAHGAEMAYLFDLVPGQPALTAAQQAVAADLVGRWARFVTTGDPATPTAPWPRWTGDGRLLTITGAEGSTGMRAAAEFADAHRCALWGS